MRHKGSKLTEEHKKKIGLANKGKVRTPETILKLKLSHLGKHYSSKTEFKKGIVSWIKGKRHSEETRKKMIIARTGKKLSLQHRKNMSLANRGSKSCLWKGGLTKKSIRIRHSLKYKLWRENVFKRDNWTCQECGKRSKKNCYIRIEAHHIKPFALFPELRFLVDNGLTLCKKCHDKKPKGKEILCIK